MIQTSNIRMSKYRNVDYKNVGRQKYLEDEDERGDESEGGR